MPQLLAKWAMMMAQVARRLSRVCHEARVAPSDQDTGSLVVLQLTRPLASGNVVRLRGEWSRSETGFRNVFFQRLGFTALYSIRVAGAARG